MRLWGKTQAELSAERNEMIARREHLAERDQRAKTPAELGAKFGDQTDRLRGVPYRSPVQRPHYYFGTDIPLPPQNTDSTGQYVIPRRHPRRGWPILVMGLLGWFVMAAMIVAVVGLAVIVREYGIL